MKRTIVASILGIAGSVAMSHGQGTVFFQNYNSAPVINAPVTFATGGTVALGGTSIPNSAVTAGMGVGSEFTADLLYSVNQTGTYTLLTFAHSGASSSGPFGYPTGFTYGSTVDGPTVGPSGANPGYFVGGGVTIPTYVTGDTIAFIVEAYNGTSYATSVGAGLWRGQSSPLLLASIASGSTPTGFMTGLQAFTVATSIPEPTTLAFAGMGLLSLLAFARRKNV